MRPIYLLAGVQKWKTIAISSSRYESGSRS